MTDETLPARVVNVGSINLNVIDTGEGPAALLLHGFPDRAQMWSHQIRDLRQAGYRVIAPDLRGYGDSDRPAEVEAYAMDHLVSDIHGLLATLDVDTFRLAGHDWGATLGWILASTWPDRVQQYAAISVGHPAAIAAAGFEQKQLTWYMLWFAFPGIAESQLPQDDWQWYRDWAYDGARRTDDRELDRQLTDLARPGALTSAMNWYRANIPPELYALTSRGSDLAPVQCSVMGIWGDRDMAMTERQMMDSGGYVAGQWRYERVHRVGHWVPTDAPARVSELLLDFFGT
ncbi:MAG TPA: alpha/beta fold hydrolase [Mycobacterium sp.]|uniref:alpha/beta fold hydrolase n=1 Tax=Mycobacterium sp. TaxID=1785 RepID=UPI002F423354